MYIAVWEGSLNIYVYNIYDIVWFMILMKFNHQTMNHQPTIYLNT